MKLLGQPVQTRHLSNLNIIGNIMIEEFEPLFKCGSDWHNNACLNYSHDMSSNYINGYKNAADTLVLHINEKASNQDSLVYPVVFLYRHHLELLLKNIIDNGLKLLGNDDERPKNHNLDSLWSGVKKIILKVWESSPEESKFIDHIIGELNKYDQYSMSFRYAKDKKDNKANPCLYYINLRHLAQSIDKVSVSLNGIDSAISEYLTDI